MIFKDYQKETYRNPPPKDPFSFLDAPSIAVETARPSGAPAAFARARDLLDRAARIRARLWTREDPLRDWERRNRVRPATGRDWRVELAACARLVSEAAEIHREIHDLEEQSLADLRTAAATLRGTRAGELLEASLAARGLARASVEEALDLSRRLAEVGPRSRPAQILAVLERRRDLLEEAGVRRRKADEGERVAFPEIDLGAPPDPALPAAGEPDGDDWESWLESLRASTPDSYSWQEEDADSEKEIRERLQQKFDHREAEREHRREEERAQFQLELNEQLQETRDELAKERSARRRVERERDDARREIGSHDPGSEELAERIARIEKALRCQEGELQTIRNLLLSLKEQVGNPGTVS